MNTEILFQIIVAHVSTSVLSKVYTALRLSKLLKNMRAYMVNSCFKVNSETRPSSILCIYMVNDMHAKDILLMFNIFISFLSAV